MDLMNTVIISNQIGAANIKLIGKRFVDRNISAGSVE